MAATMSKESLLDDDLDEPILKSHPSYMAIPDSNVLPQASVTPKQRCRKCKVITWTIVSLALLAIIAAATVLAIIFLQDDYYDDWNNSYVPRQRILVLQSSYTPNKLNDMTTDLNFRNSRSYGRRYSYELSEEFQCKFSYCEFSTIMEYDRENFSSYDAVIFDMDFKDEKNLKETYPYHPAQTYFIFAANRPDVAKHHNLHPEHSFYNLTMSYKLNSDIIWQRWHFQYKYSQKYASPQENPKWITPDLSMPSTWQVTYLEQSKTKLASAVVPCKNESKHSVLFKELQQLMTVELDNKTECENRLPSNSEQNLCTGAFNSKYKFFLAFEEHLCDDYVSENFYRAINCGLVPVVLGGADYSSFAPNHTYIDTRSFDTLQQLSNYLYDLERNLPEYGKYFWWKKYYDLKVVSPLCDICEKMMALTNRGNVRQPSQWHAVDSWWKDSGCTEKSKFGVL